MSSIDTEALVAAALRDAAASVLRSVMRQALEGYIVALEERYPDMGLREIAADEMVKLNAEIEAAAKSIREGIPHEFD